MALWEKIKAWLKEDPYESPLKAWTPERTIWGPLKEGDSITFPTAPPTPAECSDVKSPDESIAPVADLGPTGEPVSEEKSEPGGERLTWFPVETVEGEPPVEELKHAASLPGSTFRVFPCAGNHRNSYDSEGSVRRAVAARERSRERWLTVPGAVWVPDTVKVYRAETVWRDVTEEYVK